MKTKQLIIYTFACLGLCSCGAFQPQIKTYTIKKFPPLESIDSVRIYKPGDTIPNASEIIGIVNIEDTLERSEMKFEEFTHYAKKEAAKVGGNGVAITSYTTPSSLKRYFKEMNGTILHITDMNIYPDRPNPNMKIVSSTLNSELYLFNRMQVPKNTFAVSLGVGKFFDFVVDEKEEDTNLGTGVEFEFRYDRIIKKGMGFGLQYSSYSSNRDSGDLHLSYFAPNFIYKTGANNLFITLGTGIGLLNYRENRHSRNSPFTRKYAESSWGYNIDASIEYKLSKHIGIGASFGAILGNISNQIYNNESTTYNRVKAATGMKFYF